MSIDNIIQPEIIEITKILRLRKAFIQEWDIAVKWYKNEKVMYYSEVITDRVYDLDDIKRMYTYLSNIGELYFIEIFEENRWKAIGDVTLAESNLPIVIGNEKYWGLGIGRKVVKKLIDRAREIGITELIVPEIYHYNTRSSNLFKSLGFAKTDESEKAKSYKINL